MSEVRAKKALGQHFLVDLNIARKICDSLSGGEIRLRTAPAVAALPGADGQAAAGRGPEEPETAVIIAAKRGTGNAAETGAAAATGDAAVAVDGRTAEIAAGPDVFELTVCMSSPQSSKLFQKLLPGRMSLRVPDQMSCRVRNRVSWRVPGGMLRRRQGRRVCRV